MGLTCSSAAQGLSIHPHSKGSNIVLDGCIHQAKRSHSFQDGLIFSNRPLLPGEEVWVRILEVESRWHGALRVGFTTMNPNNIDSTSLPPFACPDLTDTSDFWAIGIPQELCAEGEEICFWFNRKGQALFKKKGKFKSKVLFSGIPRNTALWAMLDIYGQTKAIQLLDVNTEQPNSPCCCLDNKEPANLGSGPPGTTVTEEKTLHRPHSEQCVETSTKLDLRPDVNFQVFREEESSCVICQDRTADTLLLPCRHYSFCQQCVVKIRGQNNICPLCRRSIAVTQSIREGHLLANSGS